MVLTPRRLSCAVHWFRMQLQLISSAIFSKMLGRKKRQQLTNVTNGAEITAEMQLSVNTFEVNVISSRLEITVRALVECQQPKSKLKLLKNDMSSM